MAAFLPSAIESLAMPCPEHPAAGVTVAVPVSLRSYAPDQAATVTQCTRCLRVTPGGDNPDTPQAISTAYPDVEAGVGAVLLVGLLESLASNRDRIETLLDHLEDAGVDVFLVIDRLAADEQLDPYLDLSRRRHQLEQLV